MNLFLQPGDPVTVENRQANVMFLWAGRALIRVQFKDTGERKSVLPGSIDEEVPE